MNNSMLVNKKIKIFLIASTITIIILLAILLITYKVLKISYNSTETSDIDSQITLTRDSQGVPTINADSINDFYFALGYLHAKDRLNVIENLRSMASGNSEKFAGIDSPFLNNLSTTIGFTKNASEIASKLKENEILALKNYVRGINYLKNKNRVRNLISRDWRIEDVLAILSMKEWANSYLNNKELIFNLPDSKIQSSKNIFKNNNYLYYYREDEQQYLYILRRIKEVIEKYICTFARGNTIQITPEYSSSGAESFTTLNYEDSFNLYPGWYPVKIILNGKKTLAITYNGIPFLMSYKNESISVTQINIDADNQNFYLFDTENKNGTQFYKSAGVWKEYLSTRIPTFVENETNSEIRWATERGPIVSELISSSKIHSKILAIDSIQPGVEYVNMLLRLPFETDLEKIKQLIINSDSSLKCFTVSDKKKSYKIFSGFINQPVNNNLVFIDGSKTLKLQVSKFSSVKQVTGSDYSGSDLISARDLSNNYKNCISNEFKIIRFNQLLEKNKSYDTEQIKKIITDNTSVAAQKFVPIFLSMLGGNLLTSSKLSKIYLSDWNYKTISGLQAPSIFYTTLTLFINETYRDDFENDSEYNLNSGYLLYPDLFELCQKNITSAFDRPDTPSVETRETIFDTAFLNSMRFLNRKEGPLMEDWKWGLINRSRFTIPYERLFIFSKFFKIKDLPLSGGPDVIENIQYNNKFIATSSTSFYSLMNKETLLFKMNYSYSTSMLSDFYYGDNVIDNFKDLNESEQIYKTVINNH